MDSNGITFADSNSFEFCTLSGLGYERKGDFNLHIHRCNRFLEGKFVAMFVCLFLFL